MVSTPKTAVRLIIEIYILLLTFRSPNASWNLVIRQNFDVLLKYVLLSFGNLGDFLWIFVQKSKSFGPILKFWALFLYFSDGWIELAFWQTSEMISLSRNKFTNRTRRRCSSSRRFSNAAKSKFNTISTLFPTYV